MPLRARSCGCRSKCRRSPPAARRRGWPSWRPPWPRPSRANVRSCGNLLERGRDRLMVAEVQPLFADDLAGFMALAGDEKDVAGLELGDGAADRLAPVADL